MSIKKIFLIFVLFFSGVFLAESQVTDKKKDFVVYQSLIEDLNIKSGVNIFYLTSTFTLKKVDFKNADISKWLKKYDDVQILNSFINHIDVSLISDYIITDTIALHPFVLEVNPGQRPFITLSPVVFSGDNRFALCSVYQYNTSDDMSETIYVFEFQEGRWHIVKFLPISMT